MSNSIQTEPPTKRAELGQLLLFIADDVLGIINETLAEFSISESKFGLLLLLVPGNKSNDCIQPSELAERLGIKRASVTKQLNWLEEQEFISRKANPKDQRAVDVLITQKGYRLLEKAMPHYWQSCIEMSGSLTDEETVKLVKLLKKITPLRR
jgi:DNA-binding MarR family transcriptional regulator